MSKVPSPRTPGPELQRRPGCLRPRKKRIRAFAKAQDPAWRVHRDVRHWGLMFVIDSDFWFRVSGFPCHSSRAIPPSSRYTFRTMSRRPIARAAALTVLLSLVAPTLFAADPGPLHLTLRSREKIAGADNLYDVVERPADWDPHKTAVIVVDMWDKHWCEGANRRVAEMAPRFSAFVDALRERGVFVI